MRMRRRGIRGLPHPRWKRPMRSRTTSEANARFRPPASRDRRRCLRSTSQWEREQLQLSLSRSGGNESSNTFLFRAAVGMKRRTLLSHVVGEKVQAQREPEGADREGRSTICSLQAFQRGHPLCRSYLAASPPLHGREKCCCSLSREAGERSGESVFSLPRSGGEKWRVSFLSPAERGRRHERSEGQRGPTAQPINHPFSASHPA